MKSANVSMSFLLGSLLLFTSGQVGAEDENTGQCDGADGSCNDTPDTGKTKYLKDNIVSDEMPSDNVDTDVFEEYVNVMITFYNAKSNKQLQNKFKVTVSSLLQHASVPIQFHLVGEAESQSIARSIIKEAAKDKNISVADVDLEKLATKVGDLIAPMQKHFSYKPGSYYNHALFFMSIVLHKVMPDSMKRVIMLDADLKFRGDIKLLFDKFRLFSKSNLFGIAREGQPVYRHTFWQYRKDHPGTRVGQPPPDGLTGFNSGVLMLDLEKIRESKLYNQLLSAENVEKLTKEFHFKGHLGDQDFYTLLSLKYEWLFYVLPCEWNRQLCQWWRDHGYAEIFDQYYKCDGDIKIYHGNCNTPIPDD